MAISDWKDEFNAATRYSSECTHKDNSDNIESKHFVVGEKIPFRSITPKRTRFYGKEYAHIYRAKKKGDDKATRYAIEIYGEEHEVYSLSIVSATVKEIKHTWLSSLCNFPYTNPEHDVKVCIVLEDVVFKGRSTKLL